MDHQRSRKCLEGRRIGLKDMNEPRSMPTGQWRKKLQSVDLLANELPNNRNQS